MVIFERFEDKKFELKTFEDYQKINNFDLELIEDELNYINEKIKKEENEEVLNNLIYLKTILKMNISLKRIPSKEEIEKSKDEMYLPEYRKDGYFNSEEFKKIEKEVDTYINTLEGVTKNNLEILKQEVLKNRYNINWLPSHKRFMPGVQVIID